MIDTTNLPLLAELIASGYTPIMQFENDATEKLLYMNNNAAQPNSIRVSVTHATNQPTKPTATFAQQNPTLKTITGGVRAHLTLPASV